MVFRCGHCNKPFASSYSMKRHAESKHPVDDHERDEIENSDSSLSATEDDDGMSLDNSSGEHENIPSSEEDDGVFDGMVSRAYQQHRDEKDGLITEFQSAGASAAEAASRAHSELLPKYRKTLRNIFKRTLFDMQLIRKHPVYKTVMQKVKDLELEDFDREEAIATAYHIVNTFFTE